METIGIDWSRVNIKEELKGLSNEKVEKMGLVKIIMENNIKMLEMQKTIENIKRQKEGEIRKKKQEKKKKTINEGRKVIREMKEKERREKSRRE